MSEVFYLCVTCSVAESRSPPTQRTQSFILSSDRAFDVSLTKAPAPKAPFTAFFNALSVLLGCETLTLWVCLCCSWNQALGSFVQASFQVTLRTFSSWFDEPAFSCSFSLTSFIQQTFTWSQVLTISTHKTLNNEWKRALLWLVIYYYRHYPLSGLALGKYFMLIHKFLKTSVIYWGVYLIYEVVGKTLSTTPSRLIE